MISDEKRELQELNNKSNNSLCINKYSMLDI